MHTVILRTNNAFGASCPVRLENLGVLCKIRTKAFDPLPQWIANDLLDGLQLLTK
jgi:hypothetical protein